MCYMQIMEGSSTLKGKKKKKILKHATVTDPRLTVLAPSQANKLRDRVFRKRIETLFGKSAD